MVYWVVWSFKIYTHRRITLELHYLSLSLNLHDSHLILQIYVPKHALPRCSELDVLNTRISRHVPHSENHRRSRADSSF